jgi:flagellar basal body-associated protein FliL
MASDKAAAAPAAAAEEKKEAPKKSNNLKVLLAAVAVVGLEVGTVAMTMKLSGGPALVLANHPTTVPAAQAERDMEVKLISEPLPNMQSGKLWSYDVQVVAKVAEKNKEKVASLFAEREAEIRDKVRTIVASAKPEALGEPGLETIRRQIAYQLEQEIGKDLIKEVLIPKCNPQPRQ